jgi:hypothetical protein
VAAVESVAALRSARSAVGVTAVDMGIEAATVDMVAMATAAATVME